MVFAMIRRNRPGAERRSSRVNERRQLQDTHEAVSRLVALVFKSLTTPQFDLVTETRDQGFFG